MKKILQTKWQALPDNDRLIYVVVGLCLALAVIYYGVWRPSVNAREKLRIDILDKKSQLAQMQLQASQVRKLQGAIRLSHSGSDGLKASIQSSAKLHRIENKIKKMDATLSGSIEISLPSITFDEWITWVYGLQTENQIRVKSAHIYALSAGLINVQAELVASE